MFARAPPNPPAQKRHLTLLDRHTYLASQVSGKSGCDAKHNKAEVNLHFLNQRRLGNGPRQNLAGAAGLCGCADVIADLSSGDEQAGHSSLTVADGVQLGVPGGTGRGTS
ncbi:hypothetical protein GCM10011326_39940 [Salipiger profundus]|nr:hypothetical protein GCM10011326_39940 [Salipiger profundus]